MKRRLNNLGFTIVEALIASAIVAVVSLAGVAVISQMRNMKNRSVEVCRLHATGVIEKFRSIGYFAAVSNFTPSGSNLYYTGDPTLSLYSSLGIQDTDLWPSSVKVLDNAPSPTLNNSVLITSSLNALLAIYNKNTNGYCNTLPDGVAFAGAITAPPSPLDLPGASVTLKIVPYNTLTGVALTPSCPSGLRIAPEPLVPDASSSAFSVTTLPGSSDTVPPKVSRGGSKTNVGLKLTVTETFTNEDNQTGRCTAEQNFQYPTDITPPTPPNYAFVALRNTPYPVNADACVARPNNYVFEFGYNAPAVMEAGTVLVCRDNSVFNSYDGYDATYRAVDCKNNAAGGVSTVMAQSTQPNFIPDPNTPGIKFKEPYEARRKDLANPWKPCDQVTVCGVAPSGPSTVTGTALQPRYKTPYANLPPLCRVNIEIAALDTASNPSDTFLSTTNIDPTTIDPRNIVSVQNWDVPALTCGTTVACGTQGPGTGDFTNLAPTGLYYRCGGCL